MRDCVFCKIRDRELPKEFEYEDDDIMVFPDINPSKPVHILVVPKKHMKDFMDLDDKNLLFKVKEVIERMIKKQNLENRGYKISINGGGAQIIEHLHFHITGPMSRDMAI